MITRFCLIHEHLSYVAICIACQPTHALNHIKTSLDFTVHHNTQRTAQ